MSVTWNDVIGHLRTGQPLSASLLSRAGREIEGNVRWLREVLDAMAAGVALTDREAVLSPDTTVGAAVYWNSAASRYEPALAGTEEDTTSHAIRATKSSYALGVVQVKHNTESGDVILLGKAAVDLTAVVDNPAAAGRYYLSGQTAGRLSARRPGVGIPVLYNYGNGTVFVQASIHDFLEDHVHFQFDLTCLPAGTTSPPDLGERHIIEAADTSLPGWLPAGHEIFNDLAPRNAAFGYNMARQPALAAVWPPLPVSGAVVIWDRGDGGTIVSPHLVRCDRNGIWWMSDCEREVPWPPDFDSADLSSSLSDDGSLSDGGTVRCQLPADMRLTVAFTQMLFATDRSVVTSLTSLTPEKLRIRNCRNEAATTGDLFVELLLSLSVGEELREGATVFKALEDDVLIPGLVTEGLLAGTGVLLSSTDPLEQDDEPTVHRGRVTVSVDANPGDREISPQIVRLSDAIERLYLDIPYLGFVAGRDSSVRLRLNIPGAGLPPTPRMKIVATCLARSSGAFPSLPLSYRRLPAPDTATALPTTETDLPWTTARTVVADTYFQVESDGIPVAPGDTVLLTLGRGRSDGYGGEVGLLRLIGLVVAGT